MIPIKLTLKKKRSVAGFLFCLPAILGMLCFFLIPFVVSTMISLTTGMGSREFVGLANYQELIFNKTFQLAAGNTLRLIGIGVPLIVLFSLAVAVMLCSFLKNNAFFKSAFLFPMVLPTASVILVFKIFFDQAGIINQALEAAGVGQTADWLNGPQAFFVVLVLYLWKYAGYNIILFLASLNAVPTPYYEAAELDGAGSMTKLVRITLPLISPSLFFILVISVVNALKLFREIYILFGTYPEEGIYMLQHFMNNNFANLNYPRLSAAANLIFVLFVVFVLTLMYIKRRVGDYEL